MRGILTITSVAALTILGAAVALGVHDTGLFELDGNSITHDAAPPDGPADDWNDIYAGTSSAAVTTGIIPDPYGAVTNDNQFDMGSKDIQDVSVWHYKVAGPPSDKTDLENAYAALYSSNGTDYLYLGADRDATNGDAKLGFWIFQDHIGLNADGTFSGEHRVGDLLIESAYTSGGTNLGNINVWQWQGADGAAGHLSAAPILTGADCRASAPGDFVCSINNDAEITVAWPYQGKKLGNDTPAPSHIFAGGFNETGVNLSHFFPNGIPCFSNVLAETRAAGSSVSSSTEDFVLGTFTTCGTINGHKYLDVNGNGALDAGENGLSGWTIKLYESDGTTLIDSKVTDGNGDVGFTDIEPGDYVVCEDLISASPPWYNTDPGGSSPFCKDVTLGLGGTATENFGNGQPNIDITKTPSADDVCNGGTVDYTYVVTNNGNVDLSNVSLSDDQLGSVGGPIDLAAGESQTFTATSGAITGQVDNTVTATGNWDGLTPAATATASATVTGHTCDISLTKTPSTENVCNDSNTTVTYTYEVTNESDFFNVSGTVGDDVFGAIGSFGPIAPGGSATLTHDGTVNGTVTNTGTANGTFDDALGATATATASATVTGHDCSISLTKTPSTLTVCNGSDTDVTYTYVVTNESDFFSVTGTLSDDQFGAVGSFGPIAPGGTQTLTTTASVSGTVTNIGTADGTFNDDAGTTATATATATVTGHDCTISLTKTPSTENVCNDSNTDVTYTYVITNESDAFNVSGTLTDDQFGAVGSFGPIAPGGSQTLTTTVAINGTVTNIGTASGTFDDGAGTTVTATATATVTGHDCSISLTKTPSTENVCNDAGTQVTYTYVVTNNSDFFSVSGTISDDKFGAVGSFGPIAPGDSQTVTSTVTVNGSVTNVGTATGTFDDDAGTSATATATATVTGHDCTINLTKTPDQTSVCNGTTVTYTYVVTNNSDFYTWTGDITDDVLGTVATGIVLGPGGSQTFTASAAITGDVVNNATASGSFDDPASTTASATASAEVIGHPCGAGCTPGFWQGGVGITLWNIVNDPDWTSHGGLGTNPFIESQKFNSFFLPTGNTTVDNMTMLQIVGSGGTNVWARKAARDLIAAYLNSSFLGGAYPYDTTTILADWATAVAGGTAGFQTFHAKYSAANELGCPIGNGSLPLSTPTTGPLAAALLIPIIGVGILRRRRRS